MRLSLHSDYALRILMALGATGEQMSVDEIAGRYGVSRNHLAKVAQRLQVGRGRRPRAHQRDAQGAVHRRVNPA